MPPHSAHSVARRSKAMRVDAVDRRLSLMTVPGTILLVLSSADVPSEGGTGTASWNALATTFFVVLVGAGLLPLVGLSRFARGRLPLATMTRGTWALVPFLGMVLNASWFWQPDSGEALVPWTWILGPSVIGLATLAWRPSIAYFVALGWAVSVPAGAVLAGVALSQEVLALTAVHAADVVFVGLYIIVRRQLRDRYATEREVVHNQADLVRAHENAMQRARVTALVHDDVLTPLNAAALGQEAHALVASATQARHLIQEEMERLTQEVTALKRAGLESADAAQPAGVAGVSALLVQLRALAAVHDTPFHLTRHTSNDLGLTPSSQGALLGATREALRNAMLHAEGAPRSLEVVASASELTIEIADAGPGFDSAHVSPLRLGVSSSILARVNSQPQCEAVVMSRPGAGTRVLLTWKQS